MIVASKEKWIGSFQLREMLESLAPSRTAPAPPESGSAYLITRRPWRTNPTADCTPLYVGGNTGKSARFRTRIGDLVADMLGLFTEETGHHSGGQHLYAWCRTNQVNPLDLHIAWIEGADCHRCLENRLFGELNPILNRRVPSKCKVH